MKPFRLRNEAPAGVVPDFAFVLALGIALGLIVASADFLFALGSGPADDAGPAAVAFPFVLIFVAAFCTFFLPALILLPLARVLTLRREVLLWPFVLLYLFTWLALFFRHLIGSDFWADQIQIAAIVLAFLAGLLLHSRTASSRISLPLLSVLIAAASILLTLLPLVWVIRNSSTETSQILLLLWALPVVILPAGLLYALLRRRTIAPLAALALLVLLLPALVPSGPARTSEAAATPSPPPVNKVFLIVVDTLRAEALSCYDPAAPPTPAIDSLAFDGILFSEVNAPAPWTLPSMAALLTGISPDVHFTNRPEARLPAVFTTMGEYLQQAGYYTSAVGNNLFLAPSRNLNQGFNEYNFFPKPAPRPSFGRFLFRQTLNRNYSGDALAGNLTDFSIESVSANLDRPHFHWVHYFDPHIPYAPPYTARPRQSPPPGMHYSFDRLDDVRGGRFNPTSEQRDWIETLYLAEVKYVDREIGRFLKHLRETGIYDDSLIILTSDHGEEFWEHGNLEHGHTLYQEVLRVPLIIKLPKGEPRGISIPQRVSLEDVLPTLLDICGISYAPDSMQGRSLRPAWEQWPAVLPQRPIFASAKIYSELRRAVILNRMKCIQSLMYGHEEVFDLAADPKETKNLELTARATIEEAHAAFDEHAREVSKLQRRYAELKIARGATPSESVDMSPETVARLKALGYLR